MHALIPEPRQQAASDALRQAFGVDARLEDFQPLTGGMSGARVFRLRTRGRDHLLRLEREGADSHRHFACLAAAAEAGIAPAVRHADARSGIVITAFVKARPLAEHGGGREGLLAEMAGLVRGLQNGPAFPAGPGHLDAVDGFIADFLAADFLNPDAIAEHRLRFSQIREVWRADDVTLPSHNDLNPGNVVFDGRRMWLVDWEAAHANDRYGDLGCIAHSLNATPDQETVLLGAWLGRAPDEAESARLTLMRQVWPMAQAMLILRRVADDRPDLASRSPVLTARSIDRVLADIGAGRLDMTAPEGRLEFGKALLDQLLVGLRSPRFARALDVMGQSLGGNS